MNGKSKCDPEIKTYEDEGFSTNHHQVYMQNHSNDPHKPYRDEGINSIYNLLFCDSAALYKTGNDSPIYPWDVLLKAPVNIEEIQAVYADEALESRPRILAAGILRDNNFPVAEKTLFGIIIEVGLEKGLDVLAAYKDGTIRYINQAQKIIVWDAPTPESERLVELLFSEGKSIINKIGPLTDARRPFPQKNMIRLTFLASDGLYFGEGPFADMQQEPMAAPCIAAGLDLLKFITTQ